MAATLESPDTMDTKKNQRAGSGFTNFSTQNFGKGMQRNKRRGLGLSTGTRIIMTVASSIVCLYLYNSWALGLLFLGSAIYLCAEVKFNLVWKIYVLLAILACIAACFILIMLQILPAMGSSGRGMNLTASFERMAISINMILAIGMNTSLTGVTNTLSRACLPGFIKLPLIVLVRFVPTFFNDIQQLREAVRIRFRGQGGCWFWVRHPVLWSRILFMPLVVRLIRSGDELAVASELKGLSTKTRFGDNGLVFSRNDALALAALVLFCVISLWLQWMITPEATGMSMGSMGR